MGKNIVLIGFMGTGKSSVGQRLAEKLKMAFIDMDREIEKITGLSINQIFRKHGEIRFRSEEKLLAQKLGHESNLVILVGLRPFFKIVHYHRMYNAIELLQ